MCQSGSCSKEKTQITGSEKRGGKRRGLIEIVTIIIIVVNAKEKLILAEKRNRWPID